MDSLSFGSGRKRLLIATLVVAGIGLLVFLYISTPRVVAPTVEPVATTSVETVSPTTTVRDSLVTDSEVGADVTIMALDMKPWKWLSATYADGRVVSPVEVDAFTIRFNASGAFTAETDCNSMSGSYEARNGGLSLGSIASTKMFCEHSQETEFNALISSVLTYRFTSSGQLIMTTTDGTEVVFR